MKKFKINYKIYNQNKFGMMNKIKIYRQTYLKQLN